MAMLAEPRRKQKYSVDPRGLQWSNDESKFGQKMLEKMGWQKGKGLGANESGITEHVKVNLKSDNKGVGCTKKHADNWIAHQDDFAALLDNLNQSHGVATTNDNDSSSAKSLAEKSKSSKARVHYHRFTKGKDLSLAKTEDLDSIFGKKKSKSAPVTPQNRSEVNSDAESTNSDPASNEAKHGIITYTSSKNVQDYFAQKMAEVAKYRQGHKDLDESQDGLKNPGFGFSQVEESVNCPGFGLNQPNIKEDVKINSQEGNGQPLLAETDIVEKSLKRKKSKKKKKAKMADDELEQDKLPKKRDKNRVRGVEKWSTSVEVNPDKPESFPDDNLEVKLEIDIVNEYCTKSNNEEEKELKKRKKKCKKRKKEVVQNLDELELLCKSDEIDVEKKLDFGFPGSNLDEIPGYGHIPTASLKGRKKKRKRKN
ncbi:PIN2/TERF1-interacting telomerase inhibitor 1 [Lingula anatina]|uniref:PIN2/TERF1-interacting telomerase inhibitor 1 n=1 Tax=Lingula anatina TaxID=7574 RepID=A0A1S3J0J5_LINAN|nr:PIN2/TERF1-interacting telomerase inhibitor 1 [Lingula anatina]|eukprot:XP_013403771.1 PIN2/TERF1-interacting telomerase inhibitor 1 [Lingula anatina]